MKRAIRFIGAFAIVFCLFFSSCFYKKFYECTLRFYVYPTFEEYDEGRETWYEGYPDEELAKVAALLEEKAFTQTLIIAMGRQSTDAFVGIVQNGVNYRFDQYENTSVSDGAPYKKTYLTVHVSIAEDKELCEKLCDAIESQVPTLVKDELTVPQEYEGTACNKSERSAITEIMK